MFCTYTINLWCSHRNTEPKPFRDLAKPLFCSGLYRGEALISRCKWNRKRLEWLPSGETCWLCLAPPKNNIGPSSPDPKVHSLLLQHQWEAMHQSQQMWTQNDVSVHLIGWPLYRVQWMDDAEKCHPRELPNGQRHWSQSLGRWFLRQTCLRRGDYKVDLYDFLVWLVDNL